MGNNLNFEDPELLKAIEYTHYCSQKEFLHHNQKEPRDAIVTAAKELNILFEAKKEICNSPISQIHNSR